MRAEISADAEMPDSGPDFDDALISEIRSEVERTGARVVIIDNITYLRSGAARTSEAVKLMKRLKEQLG